MSLVRWQRVGHLLCLIALACSSACASAELKTADNHYGVAFRATLLPDDAAARITIQIDQEAQLLRELDFRIDPAVHRDFQADGDWRVSADRLLWAIPPDGGTLTYTASIPHERSPGRYDAWITESWAIFRGDDLFPPARVRSQAGASARATLTVAAPRGWTVVTPYGRGVNAELIIDNPARRFDRPTGWMAAGQLGVRREQLLGTNVAVAGPVGHGVRRQDMLALVNWTLPRLAELFGPPPDHLLIVSAGEPMWRGGLSGPKSLFIHADRPLISENGTSSLVHELVHVLAATPAAPEDDWLTEGLAEYYALEVLRRSGTISEQRYQRAHAQLAEWGADVTSLAGGESRGKTTARAATLLRTLDEMLAERGASLDAVMAQMRAEGRFSRTNLVAAATAAAGAPLPEFQAMLDALLGPGP